MILCYTTSLSERSEENNAYSEENQYFMFSVLLKDANIRADTVFVQYTSLVRIIFAVLLGFELPSDVPLNRTANFFQNVTKAVLIGQLNH